MNEKRREEIKQEARGKFKEYCDEKFQKECLGNHCGCPECEIRFYLNMIASKQSAIDEVTKEIEKEKMKRKDTNEKLNNK